MKLKHHELDPPQVSSLRGWIAYLHSVEPSFVVALERKYDLDFNADTTWSEPHE
jgi:hypothetical protein